MTEAGAAMNKRGRPRGATGIELPNLRRERLRKGWGLTDLQKVSGVDASNLSKIERGKGAQPATVRKLADALGVTTDKLVG